jgi:hypothetical protein
VGEENLTFARTGFLIAATSAKVAAVLGEQDA